MAIKEGDIIKVEYEGTLDDGTVFDSTKMNEGKPLKFEVGCGHVISGFENAVVGKEVGDEFEIHLEPSEAYGDYNEKLIQDVPKENFPQDQEIKEEMVIVLVDPNNNQIPATVTEVREDLVRIDLNHPLAGKNLNFKVKVIETGCEPDPDSCGPGCSCGHNH